MEFLIDLVVIITLPVVLAAMVLFLSFLVDIFGRK